MRRLNFLAVLSVGFLWTGDRSTCLAESWADSSAASVHVGGRAGVRRYYPGRWGIVAVDCQNSAERPQETSSLVYFLSDPSLQYSRRFWVPANAIRHSWMLVRFPDFSTAVKKAGLVSLQLDKSGGSEVAVKDSGGLMRPSRYLTVTHDTDLTGIISNRSDLGVSNDDVVDAVIGIKESAGLSLRACELFGDYMPPTAESLESLAYLVIAGDQLAADAAGMSAVRQWLIKGGRLWVMLDQVAPATVELLLGDAFDCQVVDRVGLTSVKLDAVSPALLGGKAPTAEFEEPVDLVRLITTDKNVLYSVNGWPAAFYRPVGNGHVMFTTLGARGWLRPRTGQDPHPADAASRTTPIAGTALQGVGRYLFAPSQTDILSPDRFSEALSQQIGYRIVGRNWIVAMLGSFCLALLLVGIHLQRGQRLERMVWIAPALAVVTAVLLVAIGRRSRHEVPSTVAMGQIAHVETGIEELRITGVASIFNQDEYDDEISSKSDGILWPDMSGLEGKTRRMTWTDLDGWNWENLSLPSGIRKATFEAKATLAESIEARGSFGPGGFTGTINAGPFRQVSDAIIALPSHRNLALRIASDGSFLAGPNNVLAAGHFIQGALLTDRQRRREKMYAEILEPNGAISYPTRPVLLAWAEPLDLGFVVSRGAQRVGWALLPIPLKVDPVAADTHVLIPSAFLKFTHVAGLAGHTSSAYSNSLREWLVQRTPSRIWLRFQIPEEVLPLSIEEAKLDLDINAPSWNAEIAGASEGDVVALKTLSSPVGLFPVVIQDRKALSLDADGGLLIGITLSQAEDNRAAAGKTELKLGSPWNIQSVQLEVSGVTLAPQD